MLNKDIVKIVGYIKRSHTQPNITFILLNHLSDVLKTTSVNINYVETEQDTFVNINLKETKEGYGTV